MCGNCKFCCGRNGKPCCSITDEELKDDDMIYVTCEHWEWSE